MLSITDISSVSFDSIKVDSCWNVGDEKELKMHKIHSYPAKFPAFITTKAINYAKDRGVDISKIADIFCGCGTVAFEAKRNNIDFWGCDINPVATMIARAKSQKYKSEKLEEYFKKISDRFIGCSSIKFDYENGNQRIKYWFDEEHFNDLSRLKNAIDDIVLSDEKYYLFFVCAFSNILKYCSRWLTKSIKPQLDPNKKPAEVLPTFTEQIALNIKANNESDITEKSETHIETGDFLSSSIEHQNVDMIITSPPYVTSYEYADLHQLSALWLDYAQDYRDLRKGSIGSLYHEYNFKRRIKNLNETGTSIVFRLLSAEKSKARSVAKYFLDIQKVTDKCYLMLNSGGMLLFVIGNTEYKGVLINNAKHLIESLKDSGFKDITITKRQVKGKILTPYRNKLGQFSTDKNSKKVYNEEFIVVGRRL